jgi:hypothetical protein
MKWQLNRVFFEFLRFSSVPRHVSIIASSVFILAANRLSTPPMVSPTYGGGGFECSRDPESYAGGSVATGRDTHVEQVKG